MSSKPVSSKPAPAAVALRGLTTISDNLPQGKGVNFVQQFSIIFHDELVARFLRPAQPRGFPCDPASSPSGSK